MKILGVKESKKHKELKDYLQESHLIINDENEFSFTQISSILFLLLFSI